MVQELYVWGPAFGLPSIDAECIATAAFLNSTLAYEDWTISAAHDPTASPTKSFPALKDGEQWIGGYHAIVRHIQKKQHPTSRLDSALNTQQEADTIAFSALLERHALLLIDISLYTSYENYSSITRPAYTRILPWHSNYTVPPARRESARLRTQHLGLSSLDVDTTHDSLDTGHSTMPTPSARFEAEKRAAGFSQSTSQAAKHPFWKRTGLTSLLNQPEYTTKFKLDALATTLFDPLATLLADKPYLLTTTAPSHLDCLALGYLSLLLFPSLPQRFISESLKQRFPRLVAYVTHLRNTLLAGDVPVDAVLALNDVPPNPDDIQRARAWKLLALPWAPSPPSSFGAGAYAVGAQVLAKAPFVAAYMHKAEILHEKDVLGSTVQERFIVNLANLAAGVAVVVAGVTYYSFGHMRRTDNLVFEREDVRSRGPGLGDAGDFLNTAFGP